jgi:hypothetical protein
MALVARSCSIWAFPVVKGMLDGVYSFEITFLGTVIKGIAMAEDNNIRGFNWSHVYQVERSERHGRTYWHVTETPHASETQGFVRRGFPAKLEGEEGEDRFAFEVAGEADVNDKVSIQGRRLCDLP